jgi:four helix bundle protein
LEGGYKKLEIYRIAHSLAARVHRMTLKLPSFERFEEGSQIRRSAKSVSANIVEGYALRRYKNEFIHYLFRAYGSAEETIEHLELLFETESLKDEKTFKELVDSYNILCGKLLRYIQAVDKTFERPLFMKDPGAEYSTEQQFDSIPQDPNS